MKRIGKFIIILVVLGLIVFGISYLLKSCDQDKAQSEPPAISEARYKATADGRYYYTDNYESGENYFGIYYVLHGYWCLTDGLEWEKKTGDLTISQRGHKYINVAAR